MLKKLLASALAVATVASCAYIPSALASAETKYKTADWVDYNDWLLDNQTSTATTDVTVYVGGYVTETVKLKLEATKNDAENVEASLKKHLEKADTYHASVEIKPESDSYARNTLAYFAPAGNNTYVAQVNHEVAVIFGTYQDGADVNRQAIRDTKKDTLDKLDMELLGYYPANNAEGAVDQNTVLADMFKANHASKAVVANYVFNGWKLYTGTNDISYVHPEFRDVVSLGDWQKADYTKVDLYGAAKDTYSQNMASALTSGMYYADNGVVVKSNVYVPNFDSARWSLYLTNLVKREHLGIAGVTLTNDKNEEVASYHRAGTRYVKAAKDDANQKYAIVYAADAVPSGKNVDYTLKLVEKDNLDAPIYVGDVFADWFAANLTKDEYITDAAKIYNMMKDANIDDYLTDAKDDGYVYALTGEYKRIDVNKQNKTVVVVAVVEKAEKYTVYSYGENNSVVESKVFLTKAQAENSTYYANQDYTGELAQGEKVVKATAADLGASVNATIDGVPATYAYAQKQPYGNVINCTYKLGDATAVLADFATTTGAFNAEAYFGRDAKANDKVLLKVSLSAQGEAKGLDASKISVEWNTYGTEAAGDAFFFEATEAYKAGAAQSFVLTEGTAVVTATVSYNGKVIGTFAPFYATVA